jgi:hypothetical protein
MTAKQEVETAIAAKENMTMRIEMPLGFSTQHN